jgi:hypothetical protein
MYYLSENNQPNSFYQHLIIRSLCLSILCFLVLNLAIAPALAQERDQVQELTGTIEPGEIIIYDLPSLIKGQQLYVYATATRGNLDPIIFITDTDFHPDVLEADFEAALDAAILGGEDPLETIDQVRDQHALAWDDDSGGGLSAALEYEIPQDGDYRLVTGGAISVGGMPTAGDYRMLVGLDAPEVLEGEAFPTGDTIAILNADATPPGIGVQELTGNLSQEKQSTFLELHDFKEGDTLYVYLEATSGDLAPTLVLANFANKPLRTNNFDGKRSQASLEYTFPTDSRNYLLEIGSCCESSNLTYGDYRLLLGVNAPEVLTGQALTEGRLVAREPIDVGIGLVLEQIIEVNQQSEFFTTVANLQMEWTDPALAFNPEDCNCDFKVYSEEKFQDFLSTINSKWPDFTFRNQQGNRWTQNRNVVLFHDGKAVYTERFTTDFQVDFDFRQFPFDTQEFLIHIDSIFPEEFYRYFNLEQVSSVSTDTGEDEFILQDLSVDISNTSTSNGIVSSYIFSFEAPRHLSYYIFQIFVPILLIVLISWVTFFLKNYTHRIEVASANLLLFIAFSFSLADNYPRLGYLTFMDAVMAIMFIINALVIIYNVWLRRLEMNDKVEMVERIDDVFDWVYPLIYVVLMIGLVIWFF